ncbi:DapH/DapD/GlmU-related protein [Pseudomonas piscis]|uniref:DapH/DapD/GlmU-related protein n=1 Tax=Pseudomonas piscis TaxID=2614538 RepID=UPI0039A69F50
MWARIFFFLKLFPTPKRRIFLGTRPKVYGLSKIKLPQNFSFGDNLWLEAITSYRGNVHTAHLEIGNNFIASDSLHIGCAGKIQIGTNVLVGSKVHITDHLHGIYNGEIQSPPDSPPAERPLSSDGIIIIGDNVWIGENVVVLPNTQIGSGSIIGANSIVSKSIPDKVIAVGAPARPIKKWDELQRKWIAIHN